jgi:uncharacterized protein YbbK (DUF523 family)
VYDVERLRTAYLAIKRDAASGVDGETWQHYGEKLEDNLQDLSERLKRGAYEAATVMQAHELQVLVCAGDPSATQAAPVWRRVSA